MSKIVDFVTRGNVKPKHKPLFDSGVKAANALGGSKQLDLNKYFNGGKNDKMFIGKVLNDYGTLKKDDTIIINVSFQPNQNSLVLHVSDGDSNIDYLSKLQQNGKAENTQIIGVVTHFIRALEVLDE
jgi:hypothetical protein